MAWMKTAAIEIQKQSRDSESDDQIKRLQDASEPRFWSRRPSETVKMYVPNKVVNVLHTDRQNRILQKSEQKQCNEYITDNAVRRFCQ